MVVSAGLSYRKHIPSKIYHHDLNLDRFIPNRSAMNFEFANLMLTNGRKLENLTDYQKEIAEIFDCNRTRILEFKNKPPSRSCKQASPKLKYAKPPMRHIPQRSERKLDAVEVVNDYFLNLLDWSANNILALALKNTVYLWSASDGSVSQLLSIDDNSGPVTSVKWAPDGTRIAVGFNNPKVQLWDASANRLLRTFRDIHEGRVGSLDWNNHILTKGSLDSLIINNDVRIRSHKISAYIGHNKEICGLKWSPSGQQLASGGNDSHVFIWDISLNQHRHRFSDHTAAVKALAWCPFQSNLLASGGGIGDRCIKLWNSNTGLCLNSVYTGSQVTGLLWNRHERELLSSHELYENQLTLWKYPSMVKLTELHGHTSRVLNITQSPDGYTVATVGADESLQFWNVFGTPEVGKSVKRKKEGEPFNYFARIR